MKYLQPSRVAPFLLAGALVGSPLSAIGGSFGGIRAYQLWHRLPPPEREAMLESIASAYVYGYQDGIDALWDSTFKEANKLPANERKRIEVLANKAERKSAAAPFLGEVQIHRYAGEITRLYAQYPTSRDRTPGMIFTCIMEAAIKVNHGNALGHKDEFPAAAKCVSTLR